MNPTATTRPRSPRREASARVSFSGPDARAEGWTLNISSGGLRAVVFGSRLTVGKQYGLSVSGAENRKCRVVWSREEHDGQIAGVEFVDARKRR